ncbi:unnamed protein product [Rotaria sp. Silwood2]|nr:unnamed protein product [Rotaria sp. Silwood2]
MNELFEYSDVNSFDTLNSNSTKKSFDELEEWEIQKIHEDLITVLNLTINDPCKPLNKSNSGGVMHSQRNFPGHTFDFKISDDPELLSIGKTPSHLDKNNEDTEVFNAADWMIEDSSSWKIRSPK